MHTLPMVQKFLSSALPDIHKRRLASLITAVDAVVQGAQVAITAMGRGCAGQTRIKHRVKRMDRLIGNSILGSERDQFYRVMIGQLLLNQSRPIILIDWSDFSVTRQQQLLRASVPVGGRAMTLYEELHPYDRLGNRAIQHRFLDRLHALLPADCIPIIIADSGFRTPFFRYVETLKWHWLGRIRNRDFVRWEGAPHEWVAAKSLYGSATIRAEELGAAQWVRKSPLAGRLVRIRHPRAGRKDRSLSGPRRRSKFSRKHAQRNLEPWLLIASLSLHSYEAKQIIRLYKTRMQIEEGFRDTKSVAYGLGIAKGRYTSFCRALNLLLIAALAAFALWIIGRLAKTQGWEKLVRVNSSSKSADYSALFLARLIITHLAGEPPPMCFKLAPLLAQEYRLGLELS